MTLPPSQHNDAAEADALISASVLEAQREAEAYADQKALDLEKSKENDEEGYLPAAPKLLQLSQETLQKATHDFKVKGQQLDLLLLKAESYSHFILENQKRSQLAITSSSQPNPASQSRLTRSGEKRAAAAATATSSSPNKRRKGHQGESLASPSSSSSSSSSSSDASGAFQQPSNLTGGILMPYQLEGLRWLLSLWENGTTTINPVYHVLCNTLYHTLPTHPIMHFTPSITYSSTPLTLTPLTLTLTHPHSQSL